MPHPRKEAAAEREREKKLKAREDALRKLEDAKWVDNDKLLAAKEARKSERDSKADEMARKQREKAELLRQEEIENAKSGKNRKLVAPKVKQSDIRISALSAMVFDTKKKKSDEKINGSSNLVHDLPLEPNLNKVAMIEEKEFFKISEARSAKEITIINSESKLKDQIKRPNLSALVVKVSLV